MITPSFSEEMDDNKVSSAKAESVISRITKNGWFKFAVWIIAIVVILVVASILMKVMSSTVRNFNDLSRTLEK